MKITAGMVNFEIFESMRVTKNLSIQFDDLGQLFFGHVRNLKPKNFTGFRSENHAFTRLK